MFEIEYTPYSAYSGECIGVSIAPGEGTPVALQPCGENAKTLWILDHGKTSGSNFTLINAATDNSFATPYALTEPLYAGPRSQLMTFPLLSASPGTVLKEQQWGEVTGEVVP